MLPPDLSTGSKMYSSSVRTSAVFCLGHFSKRFQCHLQVIRLFCISCALFHCLSPRILSDLNEGGYFHYDLCRERLLKNKKKNSLNSKSMSAPLDLKSVTNWPHQVTAIY